MKPLAKKLFVFSASFLLAIAAFAQEKTITVDTGEAGGWLSNNWMWLVGGLILLIIIFSVGSSRTRRTTTTRDHSDGTSTTTSTTVRED